MPWDPQQAKGVTEELSFGGGDQIFVDAQAVLVVESQFLVEIFVVGKQAALYLHHAFQIDLGGGDAGGVFDVIVDGCGQSAEPVGVSDELQIEEKILSRPAPRCTADDGIG